MISVEGGSWKLSTKSWGSVKKACEVFALSVKLVSVDHYLKEMEDGE